VCAVYGYLVFSNECKQKLLSGIFFIIEFFLEVCYLKKEFGQHGDIILTFCLSYNSNLEKGSNDNTRLPAEFHDTTKTWGTR
jgi:hypothetical protein